MSTVAHWLSALVATDSPALPALALQQWALRLQWALLLSWLGMVLALWVARRQTPRQRQSVAQGAAVVSAAAVLLLPGDWGPAFWLGLAFQWPSLLATVLCASLLWQGLRPPVPSSAGLVPLVPAAVLVLLGWLLLADTFALLPVHLYAWGFSPLAFAGLVALALAWWLWPLAGRGVSHIACALCLLAALLLHGLTRLPTGNVWDAVLDPWLWVVLQAWLVRHLLRSGRGSDGKAPVLR